MSAVDEYANRYRATLAGASDARAEDVLARVLDTLDKAVRPLSARQVRACTVARAEDVSAALRALSEAGQVAAFPRRGPGRGTYYMPADRYRKDAA